MPVLTDWPSLQLVACPQCTISTFSHTWGSSKVQDPVDVLEVPDSPGLHCRGELPCYPFDEQAWAPRPPRCSGDAEGERPEQRASSCQHPCALVAPPTTAGRNSGRVESMRLGRQTRLSGPWRCSRLPGGKDHAFTGRKCSISPHITTKCHFPSEPRALFWHVSPVLICRHSSWAPGDRGIWPALFFLAVVPTCIQGGLGACERAALSLALEPGRPHLHLHTAATHSPAPPGTAASLTS